jgi:hypothetical protein
MELGSLRARNQKTKQRTILVVNSRYYSRRHTYDVLEYQMYHEEYMCELITVADTGRDDPLDLQYHAEPQLFPVLLRYDLPPPNTIHQIHRRREGTSCTQLE